jgi:hypothetical protein
MRITLATTLLATALALSSGSAMATDFNHQTSGVARSNAFHSVTSPGYVSPVRRMPGSTVGLGPGNRTNDTNVYQDGRPRGDVWWAPTTHGG